ncbi:GTP cyclohydrolase [Candidatus Kinetoplastibacterium oncopeltii TCC290E]|uniref:GTP cyclohydrolase FolE2 n=1 Tax=Candidatus Kinetoplastidibacterium stringomonadis TCC290E TaxID=1208920 RepID=M1LZ08_9PROT|nr:GTP cyclohydrolase FolE2 [Candidatus Kinetoplastibacterium oncopeltii]AGF48369.1 GTP cyclohydrolase [Candidatus Kinetoplastibacterium oncopeltii TCC290E]
MKTIKSTLENISEIPDIQDLVDTRCIPISRVGVHNVRFPITVLDKNNNIQNTVANWTMTVSLPANKKGTHMSRFLVLLEKFKNRLMDLSSFSEMNTNMLNLLNSENGDISASFPFFLEKKAPVSNVSSLMSYDVQINIRTFYNKTEFEIVVVVPVTSLCPCSKAISEYGAHNQRSNITLSITSNKLLSIHIEDLITLVEKEASCELWSILKRPDEKYVTEYAYNNPKFVEDLVRDLAFRIDTIFPYISKYRVEAENFESIHNHSAYAVIEKKINN